MTTTHDSRSSPSRRYSAGTLEHNIRAMSAEPGSGVRMCHEQRKTAVYLSEDGQYIVTHEMNDKRHRLPLEALPRRGP